jgi:hypothetical protein
MKQLIKSSSSAGIVVNSDVIDGAIIEERNVVNDVVAVAVAYCWYFI